jgi:putative addiction module antidote
VTEHKKIEPAANSAGTVRLKKIGNSTGMILPKEIMARLNLSTGDQFYVTLTAAGGLQFTTTPNSKRRWKSRGAA